MTKRPTKGGGAVAEPEDDPEPRLALSLTASQHMALVDIVAGAIPQQYVYIDVSRGGTRTTASDLLGILLNETRRE